MSQVNAGKENVVDDEVEPAEREVNTSRPHENSSLNIRVEDVSREKSIFLEEEYQKSIVRAKENGVRRKFTEIRPGCSPNASVKSPRLLPQYLPPVIRTEIRPMSFDFISNVPANEVSTISVDSNVLSS